MFKPFRAIGYVTGDVQLASQTRGTQVFLTSCIGTSFQVYNGSRLNLVMVGNTESHGKITSIQCNKDWTYCAVSSKIIVFNRQKIDFIMECPDSFIANMLIIGDFLIALTDSSVLVYDLESKKIVNQLPLASDFKPTAIMHPATYINKIVVGSSNGDLQLWNFQSLKLVYAFQTYNSEITCVIQSPSLDVAAIGLANGTIVIHNLKTNVEIQRYRQEKRVTGISFRSDNPMMASSSDAGDVAIWDLEERRLLSVLNAHDGSIHSCEFYNGTPVLMTAGCDNALKLWAFDGGESNLPRLLKSKSGHHLPPNSVKYYGEDGHMMISSGLDQSLRVFSVIKDEQNREISQGHLEKKAKQYKVQIDQLKFPQIAHFDASTIF